jgi:mono/diheme cytochrome c family protein
MQKLIFGFITPMMAVAALAVTAYAQQPQGDAKKGSKLFVDYSCYACHGFSGQNGPGKRLVPMKMPTAVFTAYVRAPGSNQMPSYSAKVLSDQQLADIWAYVKTLPDSPEAKDIPLVQQLKAEVGK